MRLAYLTSRFPYAYIGEAFLAPEIRGLAALCEELHVISARPALRRSVFGQLGAVEVRMPPAAPGTLGQAALEALAHPIAAIGVLFAVLFGRCPARARIKNLLLLPKALAVARYVRAHRIQHIHANWLTTPGTIAYLSSRLTGVPWSCTAHAHDIFSGNLIDRKHASASFIRFIADRNLRHFRRFTAGPGAPVRLLHLGVDIPRCPAPLRESRSLRVLCAARLDPIKGHAYLLDALALARAGGVDVSCDIAGDGPLRGTLLKSIAHLGLSNVVSLRGTVAHDALLDEIQRGRYDAVVLPSLEFDANGKHEGIPIALVEAMAAGIPCITTATGCIPELVIAGTGILVEQRNPYALAQAMGALARRPEYRRRLGLAARRHASEEFDAGKTAATLYAWIEAACATADSRGHAAAAPAARPANIPAANAN